MNQLDLFTAPEQSRAPTKPDTALLLAMSADHTREPLARVPAQPVAAPADIPGCQRCSYNAHSIHLHDIRGETLCEICRAAALGYSARPNENGVYLEPTEALRLPRTVKGWRGSNLADIKLLDLGPFWIWSTGFCLYSGSHAGSSSPLTDHQPYRAKTRAEAIQSATAQLIARMQKQEGKDARAVCEWAAGFRQAQLV